MKENNPNNPTYAIGRVVDMLLSQQAVKTTAYLSQKLILRAVRKRYKNGKDKKTISRNSNIEVTLTIGKPNFAERKFIKVCQKAGEKFPVKRIQVKY